ncbi:MULTISPECIES: BRO family protein [unclassified Sphingomonas]|uniref:BRO family protein n=1 Tax=Novosphingobium rhizosphaerae TaxID=1551649 RepID=UPI0015CDDF15
MSQLIPLHFEDADVRMVMRDGDPWFVLAEVCRALGIKNARQVASRLDDDEKGVIINDTLGGPQEMTLVSEPGVLSVVLRSDGAITKGTFAYRFRRWITHEVLPSIRKHGCYPPPPEIELTLPAPERREEAPELATEGQRLFAEFKRVFHTDDWRELVPILSHAVSKSRLIAIQRGDGVMAALRHGDAWAKLTGMGIDLRYVLGNRRLLTPEERELIENVRGLGADGKAMALQSFARQIGTLCTNPDAPALSHHRS